MEKGLTSRKSFHDELYNVIDSQLYSSVKQNAIYSAKSALKTMRTKQRKGKNAGEPYFKNPRIIFNNQASHIENGYALFRVASHKIIKVKLAHYILERIKNGKIGSITITKDKVIVSYSNIIKKQTMSEQRGLLGIDMNFNNITAFNGETGETITLDISHILKVKERCRKTVSNFKRNDHRILKKITTKYGKKSNGPIGFVNEAMVIDSHQKLLLVVNNSVDTNQLFSSGKLKKKVVI